jgi:hypothetical protein
MKFDAGSDEARGRGERFIRDDLVAQEDGDAYDLLGKVSE